MKVYSASELKSAITAMMLGDAYVEYNPMSGKARLDIYHKESNLDYLLWKKELLEQVTGIKCSITEKQDKRKLLNGSTRVGYRLLTNFSSYLASLHTAAFKMKAKRCTAPLGLAVLWQDNGTLYQAKNGGRGNVVFKFANLCTERLSDKENAEIIKAWNRAYGWSPRYAEYRRNQNDETVYHRLALTKEKAILLTKILDGLLVESMRYKLLK